MNCPVCKEQLATALFHNVEVDYCPFCLGMFLEKGELELAKDHKDQNLRWLDLDLWQSPEHFKTYQKDLSKRCPACGLPFYQVLYGSSEIVVDLCRMCGGIWLDRGEFRKIIEYLKSLAQWQILNQKIKALRQEIWEIFTGPKTFREELEDVLILLKVMTHKFPKIQD